MPHLGRRYPYLVEYWAGRGWFWPNFLPWKYLASFRPGLDGIWSTILDAEGIVSEAGVPSTDFSTVSWTSSFDDDNGHNVMTLVASFHPDDVDRELQWVLTWSLNGVDVATAETDVPFASQFNIPGSWLSGVDLSTGLPCNPPGGATIQATYAEGGTPFPHPTGGNGGH